MADTAVAITAGAGTNIDTRTESTNSNHRQVVVIGDPATNAGVAPVDVTNGLSVNVTNAALTVAPHAVTNAGTFLVQNNAATPTGTNVVGRVGIDQTTPGTTNLVALAANQSVNQAQVAGTTTATGSGAMNAGTQRIALATDSPGIIATGTPGTLGSSGISATVINPSNYETVAASQTAQSLGATGATGDFINGILVVPATTSPGNVLLLDNATSITVFTGGATSVSNLVPFFIPLGMTSVSGAWKITTGTNVSCIGVGKFT